MGKADTLPPVSVRVSSTTGGSKNFNSFSCRRPQKLYETRRVAGRFAGPMRGSAQHFGLDIQEGLRIEIYIFCSVALHKKHSN